MHITLVLLAKTLWSQVHHPRADPPFIPHSHWAPAPLSLRAHVVILKDRGCPGGWITITITIRHVVRHSRSACQLGRGLSVVPDEHPQRLFSVELCLPPRSNRRRIRRCHVSIIYGGSSRTRSASFVLVGIYSHSNYNSDDKISMYYIRVSHHLVLRQVTRVRDMGKQ
jgi:hypothetical protein